MSVARARDFPVVARAANSPYALFSEFVRSNAETRDQYAALKRELSKPGWADMNEYANAKTDLIEGVIRRARNT